jgi:hypothetical protein
MHLLGGLEDEHRGAGHLTPARGEDLRHRDGDGGVTVVSARVHDAGRTGGERRLEQFGEGQRVGVGAPRHRAAGRVPAQHAHHAGAGDARPHLEPGGLQPLGDDAGRALLLERQLRVAVEIPPERDHAVLSPSRLLGPCEPCLRHAGEGSLLGP